MTEPTTDEHVTAAQVALDVAEEHYRRAQADQRYAAAVLNAAGLDRAASA